MAALRLSLSPSLFPSPFERLISSHVSALPRTTHPCASRTRRRLLSVSAAAAIAGDVPLHPLLKDLSDGLQLPPDYLAQLPKDLRLDLNDAAFDLSNGAVLDECGEEVGELLLNLAKAWELADTATANTIAAQIPSLEELLNGSTRSALGRRLVAAGRRFQAMGQYGQGETLRIAEVMLKTGKQLLISPATNAEAEARKERKLKFGEIEFEVTRERAYIGAAVGVAFGILSWQLARGVEGIQENSLQYANDNALLLAKSLRGALLALCYSSAVLSAVASTGLLFLGIQLPETERR